MFEADGCRATQAAVEKSASTENPQLSEEDPIMRKMLDIETEVEAYEKQVRLTDD